MPSIFPGASTQPKLPETTKPLTPTKLAPVAPEAPIEQPPSLREFGDAAATRKNIYDSVIKAASTIEPMANTRYSLHLSKPYWADPEERSMTERKKAILTGQTMYRRLRGTWTLKDLEGNQLAQKESTLAQVPHMTEQGTFVLGGSEYTLGHQMRLRPGIYHREKENGELEAHINIMPGKGLSHHYFLEPKTGVFKLNIGQASMPLMPVIQAMGATDEEIKKHWGPELWAANKAKDDPRVIDKLYERLVGKHGLPNASHEDKRKAVATVMQSMELDPEVTKRTLGQPYKNISKDVALATTRKLLDINQGKAETDDRDALMFQHFLGPEDLFAERIGRDKSVMRELLWRASTKGNLDKLPSGAFTKHVHDAITGSGLGQVNEEVNPSELLDMQTRVSRLGYGGIPCHSSDTEVLTVDGWKPWPLVTENDQLAGCLNGQMIFEKPLQLYCNNYDGQLLRGVTNRIDYLVTPDHRMFVSRPTTGPGHVATWSPYGFRTAEDVHGKRCRHRIATGAYLGGVPAPVNFVIPPAPVTGQNAGSAKQQDTVVAFKDWIKFLGYYLADGSYSYKPDSREYRIEIGKVRRVNPAEYALLVEVLESLGFAYRYDQEKRFVINGKYLAYYVSQFGKSATKYVPDYIMTADLETRRTFFDALTTMDHAGDRLGKSFIYSSASRRMAEQIGWLAISLGYAVTYYTRQKPDENPYYHVIVRRETESCIAKQHRGEQFASEHYTGLVYCARMRGELLLTRRNGKTFWSGNSIDAVPDEARSVQPSHLGFIDLLRTPECSLPDAEVFTSNGWKSWPSVTEQDAIACLADGRLSFHKPIKLIAADYVGPIYFAKTEFIDFGVTPNHRHYIQKAGCRLDYCFETADRTFNKSCRWFKTGHLPYVGTNSELIKPIHCTDLDWAELVGWYMSEGCCILHGINISQSKVVNPANCRQLEALFDRLAVDWTPLKSGKGYNINNTTLRDYFKPFGFCDEKCIPEELLQATEPVRKQLFDALLLGDGRRSPNKSDKGLLTQFCSSSLRLAEGFERLAVSLGHPCRMVFEKDERQPQYLGCYVVHLHQRTRRQVSRFSPWTGKPYHWIEQYSGKVYCVQVPGGIFYTRRKGSVGYWTGNSFKVGVDSRVGFAARKGSDGRIYTPFVDPKTRQTVYRSPQDVAEMTIAFPGEMESGEPLVSAQVGSKTRLVPRNKVQLVMPHAENWFNPINNMVPLKSAVKGQRAAMASRFITQALPPAEAESPFVRGQVPGMLGRSYEEHYGKHMGAIHAKDVAGRVAKVDPEGITVRYADGSVHRHEIYNHMPYNRKTYLHNTPTVQPGDPVQPGQLLAKSNYTDSKGAVALGKNLRVAYMPFRGANYEDAYVISQSGAKLLSSEHMYQHNLEWDDKHRRGKKAYVSLFPTTWDKKTLQNVDDDGIVQPGTVVNPGDPLILAARERELSKKQVHSAHKGSWMDGSTTWEHHASGIVTDVAKTDKGVVVAVKSINQMQVGDKMSGRYGDKGVVSQIIPDEEMPHDEQGNPYHVLANPLGVISRCYDSKTEFLTRNGWKFGKDVPLDAELLIFEPSTGATSWGCQLQPMFVKTYVGDMLHCRAKHVDFMVTPNHKMWAKCDHPAATWQETTAERIFERRWWVPTVGNMPLPGVEQSFVLKDLPEYSHKDTQTPRGDITIDASDFAEFLGWYLAEGHTVFKVPCGDKKSEYKVFISQSEIANPGYCEEIAELLDRLPFTWFYKHSTQQFVINSKRLAWFTRQFGKAHKKFVPDWLFGQPCTIRQVFLDALWKGDGHIGTTATGNVKTLGVTSSRLVDDVQILWQLQGVASIKRRIKVKPKYRPMWRCAVMLKKTDRMLSNHRWRRVAYNGLIYCPTVATGYVVTRRNGKPLIAGNTNPAQMIEGALGKITERTGKRYTLDDFDPRRDWTQYAMGELAKNGMKGAETVIDPTTGRHIPNIFTGNRFFMKLHHTSESKGQGRGLGAYTAEGMPAKTGGPEGSSKRMAMMDIHALLSHGAIQTLRDIKLIRGQKNQEYWSDYMSGFKPPTPQVPLVYEKFVNQLKAGGVNVQRLGNQLHIMALRDSDVQELAGNREIENAETVDWKPGMNPIKGGLFDDRLTGGHEGNRWAKITLHEPMPNPVFEEPVRRMLGLTKAKFMDVLAGREPLNGQKGPKAIHAALKAINVDQAITQARADINSGRRTARDEAIRKLGYLKGAQKNDIHPSDWMMTQVPVIPPKFRPVSVMQGKGGRLIADANYLYKELFDANQNLKDLSGKVEDVSSERETLYNSFKAVTGLGDPVQPKNQERKVKGMLAQIFGNSPKFSTVQQKLLGTSTELVGRATVVPNPDLHMDQIGLPEARAWEVYTPFIVRRLVKRGVPHLKALEYVKNRHELARSTLLEELNDRPVIMTRAPVLHRYGEMAFFPRLTKGDTLQVSPIVVGGFGMDFDGDAANYHVPASDEARDELVQRLLPSKNLLSTSRFGVHYLPKLEYQGGLWQATNKVNSEKSARTFATRHEALQAYYRGELDPDHPVHILDEKR